MGKGSGENKLACVERRLAIDVHALIAPDGATRTTDERPHTTLVHEAQLAGVIRALAPHSPATRTLAVELIRTFLKQGDTTRELYVACMRALCDSGDKRLPAVLKLALASEDYGGLPALSVACFCDEKDRAVSEALGKAVRSQKTFVSFAAEVARLFRGEPAGPLLVALAPRIKEAHRIALCLELLLPLAERGKSEIVSKPLGEALSVLRSAERHLGRWLIMAEVAHRAGDASPLEEAIEKSQAGPSSSRGAWSFVAWALDPTQNALAARPTAEVVARLSHRPSADRDPSFLFRLGEGREKTAEQALMALSRSHDQAAGVRASLILAKAFAHKESLEDLRHTAQNGGRDDIVALAAASLWDLGEKSVAEVAAAKFDSSSSLGALAWSCLVESARKGKGPIVTDGTFRRLSCGWVE